MSILLVAVFVLGGCANNNTSGQISYDDEQLRSQLEEAFYQPLLPTKFPFEVEDASFSPIPTDNDEKVFNFDFIRKDNVVELMTFNGESINDDTKTEKVKFDETEGEYFESNDKGTTVKHLIWKEDGVVYDLSTANDSESQGISKEELIQIAESFK